MSYVRVSLMQPKSGKHAEVRELLDDLAGFFAQQPGFIEGYGLYSSDSLVGRVTVWESADSADAAAQSNHVLGAISPQHGRGGGFTPGARVRGDPVYACLVRARRAS